jgi:hypothetical protein
MSILNIANHPGSTYQFAFDVVKHNTNVTGNVVGTLGTKLGGLAASSLGSVTAIPQVTQFAQTVISANSSNDPGRMYTAVPYTNLNRIPGVAYPDFRSRKGISGGSVISTRVDGAALATRSSLASIWLPILYAASSALPTGAYAVFNREADGPFGFGWGDHGNIYALRNDFTAQSHVATTWLNDSWQKTKNIISKVTPFRGDRVQVIDYKKSVTLSSIYRWNDSILGADFSGLGITQDFVKFFFTGPKLSPAAAQLGTSIAGLATDITDDAVVFRATISSLTDSFNPSWTSVQMIGRADSNFHYTAYSRDIQLSFVIYATDRDEMKPIWRKLNALAGYTAPTYNANSISLEAPWIRFTIGDLYFQQPAIIQSLTYTLHDTDTTWEINIEKDEAMMQVPKKVDVNMTLTLITNELPQRHGKFYTLAKKFDANSNTKPGTDNWLSDMDGRPQTNALTE